VQPWRHGRAQHPQRMHHYGYRIMNSCCTRNVAILVQQGMEAHGFAQGILAWLLLSLAQRRVPAALLAQQHHMSLGCTLMNPSLFLGGFGGMSMCGRCQLRAGLGVMGVSSCWDIHAVWHRAPPSHIAFGRDIQLGVQVLWVTRCIRSRASTFPWYRSPRTGPKETGPRAHLARLASQH
jgi:hypothetical protein